MKRSDRFDAPGAGNIPMSPIHRDMRDAERKGVFKARGIQPACRRCRRHCKVLRGTPGTKSEFICYDALEESAR